MLLSKVVGKEQTKTDGSNSIFNVVGKRKTKTESRIPFSDDVGKRKTKLEVQIPFSYLAGKRLAQRYTHFLGPQICIFFRNWQWEAGVMLPKSENRDCKEDFILMDQNFLIFLMD